MKRKTNGGVLKHAVDRVKKQYNCPLDSKEIRRVLRKEKNNSGIVDGAIKINPAKLKIQWEFPGRVLIAIIVGKVIVTVEDKIRRTDSDSYMIPESDRINFARCLRD